MENGFLQEALEKLRKEAAGVSGVKESAMKDAVKTALEEFCCQDAEFAQAVAQGGSLAECMKAVARGVGRSISDMEAYKRAVAFYFPGATVEFQMTVDVCPNRVRTEDVQKEPILLNLEAFF